MKPLEPLTVALADTSVIEASAGTGKTYTIATLYLRLLLERESDVSRILVVTYTNAATAELRDRIRARLREALEALRRGDAGDDDTLRALLESRRAAGGLERDRAVLAHALSEFDRASIFTIHGFCQRVLQENAFESCVPFEVELLTDQSLLLDEIVRDFWAREMSAQPGFVVRFLAGTGFTLGGLRKIAGLAAAAPDAEVLPEPSPDEVAAAHVVWQGAFERAAALWVKSRTEVIAILCGGGVLNGQSYSPRRIRSTWIPLLDEEMSAGRPGIHRRFDKLENLTPTVLRDKTNKKRTTPEHPFFDACGALFAAEEALDVELGRRRLRLSRELVDYARLELRRRKDEAGLQSYEDLLHQLDQALEGSRGEVLARAVAERFPVGLIDEFQDTDPVQYRIFRRIYVEQGGTLFLIGDPKQAIYSFRGADLHAYLSARSDAPDQQYTLSVNYRSDPALLGAVSALFARVHDPFLFAEIPFPTVGLRPEARERLEGAPPFEVLVLPGDQWTKTQVNRTVPRRIAAEISRFLQSGATIDGRAVEPGDVAVLCRKNVQARDTQAELRRLGVPCVYQGDSSVFDAPEAAEVERVLAAMADPADRAAVGAALATGFVGLDAAELHFLRSDEAAWDARMRELAALNELWTTRGFVASFRRMLDVFGVPERLLGLLDGERRLTNLLHLGELLQNAAAASHLGPLALVAWLNRMRLDPSSRAELAAEAMQIRLESDERLVKLTTIHQAKGLEYPVVYCPFLWDGKLQFGAPDDPVRFHDAGDGDRLKIDLGSTDHAGHRSFAERETLAENLRLLYVALTRARHRCVVVWGSIKEAESSPLGYLLHRPAELPSGSAWQEVVAAVRMRIASAAALREDLIRVSSAIGSMAVGDLDEEGGRPYPRPAAGPETLSCPRADRTLAGPWRTSSFSRLASGGARLSEPAAEGRDRDEAEAPLFERRPSAEPVLLHAFPRGARPGELVHSIFESIDFRAAEDARPVVERCLHEHGLEGSWAEALTRAVVEVVDTPLAPGGLTLREIPPAARRNELEFLFPVGGDGSGTLTPKRLAEVFARHRAPAAWPGYAERLRDLGFSPLEGFLRGFVDLVFERAARWYVVDYKSNFLGASPQDYARPRLDEPMAAHHYFLQYHLYVVALHRHLRARLPGYDYDAHFGGVYYLFVRGMSPRHPAGCGVFDDRPPRGLIEDLSALLGRPDDTREKR